MNLLNGKLFKDLLVSACNNLTNNKDLVDKLNVFPVPDGDTGTNMSLTFSSGVENALKVESESLSDVANALSKGLLMGARGNSGVILSQIFRGFAKYLKDKNEASVIDVAKAFENGTIVAYKAIMKAVEGTILTVIRESSYYSCKEVENKSLDNLSLYFSCLLDEANKSLQTTPDLLPALKEAGVVDSGGTGLCKIFEGFKSAIDGKIIEANENVEIVEETVEQEMKKILIKFELSLEYKKIFKTEIFVNKLEVFANNIKVETNGSTVNLICTSKSINDVLLRVMKYGQILDVCLSKDIDQEVKQEKKYGLICVSAGDGLSQLFTSYGVDEVITGGQTMNPSTQDFVNSINKLNHCKNIVILPNNSNIILAAKQAKDILKDKSIIVIETKSIQEGISSLLMFDESLDANNLECNMNEAKNSTTSASITYAIKDTNFSGVEVHANDYISILGKTLVSSNKNCLDCVKELLNKLFEIESGSLITIIKGLDSKDSEVEEIQTYIEQNSKLEVQVIDGGQPVYNYLFSLE